MTYWLRSMNTLLLPVNSHTSRNFWCKCFSYFMWYYLLPNNDGFIFCTNLKLSIVFLKNRVHMIPEQSFSEGYKVYGRYSCVIVVHASSSVLYSLNKGVKHEIQNETIWVRYLFSWFTLEVETTSQIVFIDGNYWFLFAFLFCLYALCIKASTCDTTYGLEFVTIFEWNMLE